MNPITINDAVRKEFSESDLALLHQRATEFDDLVRRCGAHEFEPFAVYEKDLDCIRVIVKDCSVCEFRINELLTVFHDNNPASEPLPIGFTIKGIRAKFGHQFDGIVKLTELLDALVKKSPEEAVMQLVMMLKKITSKANLEQVELLRAA